MSKNKMLVVFLALLLVFAHSEAPTTPQTKARVQTLLYLE